MTFTPEEIRELKQQAAALPPLLRIGKQGLTPGVIREVARQLEERGLIKIKLLKAASVNQATHASADQLAMETSSTVVHVVGSIVILAKKPGREHSAFAKRRVSCF